MWRVALGYLCDALVAGVIAAAIWLVLSACVGCGFAKDVGGEIGGTAAEFAICPTGLIDCGEVLMCEAVADNELGHVEICVDTDGHPEHLAQVEEAYGPCEPTPRHQGLCLYCCGADCGRGGNAFSGTWCP